MMGVPARQTGWMSKFGERLDALPLTGDGHCTCEHTGTRYVLAAGQLKVEG